MRFESFKVRLLYFLSSSCVIFLNSGSFANENVCKNGRPNIIFMMADDAVKRFFFN